MDPAELVNLSVEIIQDYNPLRVTPSTQCDLFFKKKKITDPSIQSFLREIFFGAERYHKMLKIVVDGLFARHSSQVTRLDYTLYVVMTLLIVKKQKELGFSNFRNFILAQTPHKMHTLIGFLYSDENMRPGGWLEEQWALVYDIHFVQNNLIGGMKEVGEEVEELMEELTQIIMPGSLDDSEAKAARPKKFTKPQPFKLSESSPKAAKPRTPIYKNREFKAMAMPESLKQTSLEQIKREKDERRQEHREESKIKHKNSERFKLLCEERPTNIDRLREEQALLEERARTQHKAKEMPKFTHNSSSIKLTAAQILRDEALYQKRAAEEAAKLRLFEENLRDEQEFMTWQSKMKAQDEAEEKRILEERRQDMAEASERAQAAVKATIESNKEFVADAREEMDRMMAMREAANEANIEANRLNKERILKEQEQVAIVHAQMVEDKRQEALKAQMARDKRAAAMKKHRREDLKKKKELIMAIQAMEKLAGARAKRPKEFDPSTASGVGLLEEMSLAELGERLNLMKIREEEDKERKRREILEVKQEKQDILDAMVKKHTNRRAEADAKRFENTCSKKTAVAMALAKKNRALKAAHDKFDKQKAAEHKAKRERAMQLARELKAKRNAENFELSSSGGRVDAKDAANAARAERYMRDVNKGLARHQKELVRNQKRDKDMAAAARNVDHRQRHRNLTKKARSIKKMNRDHDRMVANYTNEGNMLENARDHVNRQSAAYVKGQREATIRKNKARNQYAADQTEKALAIARAARQRPRSGRRARSADSVQSYNLDDSLEDELELTQVRPQRRPGSSHETSSAAISGVDFETDQVPLAVA